MRAAALALALGACSAPSASHPELRGDRPSTCDPAVTPDAGACLLEVRGRVVDELGVPLGSRLISVCAQACFYGTTTADGSFTVAVGVDLPVAEFATLLHGRPDRASYYLPLPPLVAGVATYPAPLPLPLLPASGPSIALDGSAQVLTAAGVTVSLAAGNRVQLSVEDVADGAVGDEWRPLEIANPAGTPLFAAGTAPDALFALAPFEASLSAPAAVTIANRYGWAPGSAVDVQVMRSLLVDGPPGGPFVHAAAAHVSSDGSSITTDPGQGVRSLTWLALRKM